MSVDSVDSVPPVCLVRAVVGTELVLPPLTSARLQVPTLPCPAHAGTCPLPAALKLPAPANLWPLPGPYQPRKPATKLREASNKLFVGLGGLVLAKILQAPLVNN